MFLISLLFAVAAVIAGILLAVLSKKAEGVTYGKLDRAGRITNILLIPVYLFISPFILFLAMVSEPCSGGFLAVLGWIVALLIASAPLFSGIGLGLSVALRKKGRQKASFAVQFAGFAGNALAVLLYATCVGTLILPLN